MAQAALYLGQEWEEVRDIGAVEGLGEFGEDEFAPAVNFGGDDAGGIAPVELTDADGAGGHRFASRRWWWVGGCAPVMAAFAAQAAVGVTGWLLGFVEAVAKVGFGVIFLDPSNDVFGVEGNALAEVNADWRQFSLDQSHAAIEQELERLVGHRA